ncbi:AP endonuclease [Trametes versicolor FP-101664 SS1]|uniref:AP endonuclease n=1 Tax=Trametes versicolor (strain FP-101664) TaxID=717944 RepID=UPI0004623369|nr:AP endonuclease [Trametes versicolor FP-101664 SS1]EIW61189.1 AP endonuclease [Trametes versicolor FP-101664 SS1]
MAALRRSTRIATPTASTSLISSKDTANGRRARSPSGSSLSSLSSPFNLHADANPRPTKRARTGAAKDPATPLQEKQRRTKKGPIAEPKPDDFSVRATSAWKVGPHVSSAGGVENAIINAASVGANAFAIFLKSQRKWESDALKDESIAKFKERMKTFGYSPSHILPHGSYLVNLGNPDSEKREKSFTCFLDDLKRCEQLGLHLYNFHPGSTVGAGTIEESLALIAECINRAHTETASVVIVLENMCCVRRCQAGSGNVIGSRFSDLGGIIKQVSDKTRVGVCLDTCEFPYGYNITTLEGWRYTPPRVVEEFEREVGAHYLRGMHLNDSKGALGSKKDRHENIGQGHLGLRTFAHILSDLRTRDIPLVLETPAYDVPTGSSAAARESLATEGMGVWRTEVAVLNRLARRSAEEVGEEEIGEMRAEIAEAVVKASKVRDAKGKKPVVGGKSGRKSKKKVEVEEEDDDDDSCCESAH